MQYFSKTTRLNEKVCLWTGGFALRRVIYTDSCSMPQPLFYLFPNLFPILKKNGELRIAVPQLPKAYFIPNWYMMNP